MNWLSQGIWFVTNQKPYSSNDRQNWSSVQDLRPREVQPKDLREFQSSKNSGNICVNSIQEIKFNKDSLNFKFLQNEYNRIVFLKSQYSKYRLRDFKFYIAFKTIIQRETEIRTRRYSWDDTRLRSWEHFAEFWTNKRFICRFDFRTQIFAQSGHHFQCSVKFKVVWCEIQRVTE